MPLMTDLEKAFQPQIDTLPQATVESIDKAHTINPIPEQGFYTVCVGDKFGRLFYIEQDKTVLNVKTVWSHDIASLLEKYDLVPNESPMPRLKLKRT